MYSFHYNEIAEGRNVASCKSLKMHHFPAGDVKLVLEWADGSLKAPDSAIADLSRFELTALR